MTLFLAAMTMAWCLLLGAYVRMYRRYQDLAAPRQRLQVSYAAGSLPDCPFEYQQAQARYIVVAVEPGVLVVRDRRPSDWLVQRVRPVRWAAHYAGRWLVRR